MALTSKLTAIANSIRSKTGDTATMTLDEMPTKIDNISGSELLAVFSQVNPLVASYMENVTYDSSDYTVSSVLSYSYTETDYDKGKPSGYSVSLKDAGEIRLSDDVSSIEDTSAAGSYTLYNAKPNYAANWCNIVAENIKQSGTIKPTGQVRMINTTASNVRDLGGWTCDGGTIKYGKIFRGGELSANDKHVLVEQLRIKHDIDLRGKVDNNNGGAISSPLGDSVEYTPTEKYVWYSINNNAEEWKLILGTIFNAVKADEPVIFHCAAGADRTGTVACIVEALLGVAQNDIDKDFELTSFAIHPNARRRTDDNWKTLISEIDAFVVGDTFRDKVVNFVGTLGFTSDDINAFRHSMIDGTPADIIVVEPPQGRLPKEYQEVEWIGGSNDANYTFCIKPDLTWDNFDKIEFAGFRDNYDGYSGSNGIMLLATWTSASTRTSPYVAFRDSKSGIYFSGVTGTIDNNFMQAQLRESDFKTFTVTFTSHSNSGQVEFGSWSDANFGSNWQTKEQKWYSGTELVRHLVPCYRTADDVAGMYDLVTSAFFTNAGGGIFIKGSNVQAN